MSAEKWKETKVNLPTTLVSTGKRKKIPLVGFCITEVVGSLNCLGTAKHIICVLLSKASVDCGGHELDSVQNYAGLHKYAQQSSKGGLFFFCFGYSADRRPPNHQGSSLSSQSIRRGPVGCLMEYSYAHLTLHIKHCHVFLCI